MLPDNSHVDPGMKRRILVTPWRNVTEFHEVSECLFGAKANVHTYRKAFERMHVWSLRRSTLCPAAVLATSVILEVKLKDMSDEGEGVSEILQTLYANAFTRFFNYMSSIMQTHNLRTMYDTARELGLQSFVVDLRHICAHSQVLPPLEVLRNTADYCLNWLRDSYWNHHQGVNMMNADASRIRHRAKTQFEDDVLQLFSVYDTALECQLKGAHNLKTAKRHLHAKRFAHLKTYCNESKIISLQSIYDVVIKDLMASVRRDRVIRDLPEIYIEALLKMKHFFMAGAKEKTDEEFETLIASTQSLFRMLAVNGFIEDIFFRLLDIAESASQDLNRQAGAGFWSKQIADGFVVFRKCKQMYNEEYDKNHSTKDFDFSSLNLDNLSKKMRRVFIYGGVDLKRTLIFGDSFRRPWVWIFERNILERHLELINKHSGPAIKKLLLLIEPALTAHEINALTNLIDVVTGSCGNSSENIKCTDEIYDKIYTPKDLLKELGESEKIEDTEFESCKQLGIWSMATDDELHSWPICPLGRLPWQ